MRSTSLEAVFPLLTRFPLPAFLAPIRIILARRYFYFLFPLRSEYFTCPYVVLLVYRLVLVSCPSGYISSWLVLLHRPWYVPYLLCLFCVC